MRRYIRVNNKILIIIVTVIIFSLAAGVVLSLEEQTAFALQVKKSSPNVTASVDNTFPVQNSIVNITVTGPAGAEVRIVCHYKSGDTYYSGMIQSNERTIIPVLVGLAEPGYAVSVDVSVISDKIYTTQTMFIPQ
ncbi:MULTISPECIES: hypothetical protein [Clostridium]|uniref:Uncharacterized protein n=2 Tax=Clostridium TaxID=1485 RepID=A0A151ALL1_9CLOT|nr:MULTISPECIES: hypothetical protein [Clostridium]KYH28533.1 hypothetical protein CLCOL_17940 [Clostridium colicanis DSM 13634]MBE6042825.1 hypothetical protein [Clostridium thermopalmarium]PRR69838.1 hypothetical protein CPAL_23910 [Clostridium thermopalmarium DSM 5974]PVZ21597.1 hypothetical protein LX19_02071 [Clostridium thermopalmarium DSM 5974]